MVPITLIIKLLWVMYNYCNMLNWEGGGSLLGFIERVEVQRMIMACPALAEGSVRSVIWKQNPRHWCSVSVTAIVRSMGGYLQQNKSEP